MSRLRIVNLGLPKSGTTTLAVALTHAGLRVADWRIRRGQASDPALRGAFVGNLMYRGYFETGDPLANLEDFDALTEISIVAHGLNLWPQMDYGLLAALRQAHPEARFLLSARSTAAIVESMLKWSNLGRSRLPNAAVPGLPETFGARPGELERWIDGHHAFCRALFADGEAFLEYDPADPRAPERIGRFLGIDLPWWGTANRNPNAGGAVAR